MVARVFPALGSVYWYKRCSVARTVNLSYSYLPEWLVRHKGFSSLSIFDFVSNSLIFNKINF